ncbi:SlyX family protein [Uruburuella testudinis]|uniref:Protein SlyX homolog n=1 Tax=Uruburuella testudinis TaxID=1282863 RepID=A0ABY4DSN7_9NEIS|nr:SlyX family protein [Uruburuella testudinis]UOO82066.1 SlyX family protein [Uruburuella testudinis]
MDGLEARIVELEIQTALQEDLIGSLNDTVAKMQQTLDLQQAQLRLLYQRIQDRSPGAEAGAHQPADDVPPHY